MYITLHLYITLHYTTWHYIAWHDMTWHDMTWQYITFVQHMSSVHNITSRYITCNYINHTCPYTIWYYHTLPYYMGACMYACIHNFGLSASKLKTMFHLCGPTAGGIPFGFPIKTYSPHELACTACFFRDFCSWTPSWSVAPFSFA